MTIPTQAQIEAVITDIDTRMQGKSFAIMTAPEWLIISQAAALAAAQVGEQPHLTHSVDFQEGIAEGTVATIERCAQKLEQLKGRAGEFGKLVLQDAADELRKLKEQP